MTEERKPSMSIQEIEAVLVDLPHDQLDDLLERVMSQRTETADEIDPAVLAEAHRRLDEMKSGRVAPVPFEQLLDDLDRLAS
ncbi:MAG TPA: addiction module protein [Longimicrobium sp.]|nr:addiction module protein [Longimicrobium sp.]